MKESTDSPTLPSNSEPARPAAPADKDLIAHCIQFMADKEDIKTLFENTPMRYRANDSYKKRAEEFLKFPELLSIDRVRETLREKWKKNEDRKGTIDFHIANLKSEKLAGHDWYKAMPSTLHRKFQDLVRECTSLDEYLAQGNNIVKHEYFMTATHDICEYRIIEEFEDDVIPPTQDKSVSDFVFKGIPYDLKVTTIKSNPEKWKQKAGRMTLDEKKQLALELYGKADSERMRKDAEQCSHNWGLNRMYYVVRDQDKWLKEPEDTIQYLLKGLKNEDNFFKLEVGKKQKYRVRVCLVEQ